MSKAQEGGELPPADSSSPEEPAESVMATVDAAFERRIAEVETAAREWGLRWHEPEGRFISALLGAMRRLGELGRGSHGVLERIACDGRAAAVADRDQARLLREQAELELLQVRTLKAALVVEHENVTLRMIKETLPLFADKLQGALIIREREWNRRVERRRFAVAGVTVLAIFLGGMGLQMWFDSDRIAAFDRCLAQSFISDGRAYCALPDWEPEAPRTTKP
jgi:hypothetical protein